MSASFAKSPSDLIKEKLGPLTDLSLDVQVNIPEAQFGDYSTNAALVAAKMAGQAPMDMANDLVAKLQSDSEVQNYFSAVEAIKPGFINFKLAPGYLEEFLQSINKNPDRHGAQSQAGPGLVLVEYFQLNVAKPPHVGHLRSAVIGDSLKRIFRSLGFKTVSDTHIGDWGTQFGILLWAYKNLDGRTKVGSDPLEDLNKLYVEANNLIEQQPEIREQAKQEFVKLEAGDKENRKLWEFFLSASVKEFDRVIARLNLLPFDYNLGESFYEALMKDVSQKLEKKNLLTTGETGEKYVDLEEWKLGRMICVKSDGATTYALRDLAALYYRYEQLPKKEKAELRSNIYVVDNRQSRHFQQVFKVFALLGEHDAAKSVHVEFGFMSLPEGALSTRKGTAIALAALLDEAERRASSIINEKNPGLANKEAVAKMVGLGAIKYFDLAHNRKSDIVFRWDEVLNFEGNTGPYLQYTHARLKSILRKANLDPRKFDLSNSPFPEGPELELARKLIHFGDVISMAAAEYLPNILANYLYELAGLINNFYHSVPVLQEGSEDLRNLRLAIVAASATTLKNGLYLLGIEAPEEM